MGSVGLEGFEGTEMHAAPEVIITDEIRVGNLKAMRLSDAMDWGVGKIQPPHEYADSDSQRQLVVAALESIEKVAEEEKRYSCCTDGRCPLHLANGELVPVREQLVGADIVSAFHMAEVLGGRFYKDPFAPVEDRVEEVANFLFANELIPSTHIQCGAGDGYESISRNLLQFLTNPIFVARSRLLLPEGVYSDTLHEEIIHGIQERLDQDAYKGLNGDVFVRVIEKVSGLRAIAELNDDGRGVHGHVEEIIMRLRFRGKAINEAKLMSNTNGREVFGVNDPRMDMLAQMFGRGRDDDTRLARLGVEYFTNGAHGTLAKGLPTWVVVEEVQ